MDTTFDILHSPTEAELNQLKGYFAEYLRIEYPTLRPESEDKKFIVAAHSCAGEYIGGISGNFYWDGLEIDTLWVKESQRCHHIGSRLLREAEKFAAKQGAVIAFLKTVDARRFYEKSGYEVYGVLEDRPIGSNLYHLKKRLIPEV